MRTCNLTLATTIKVYKTMIRPVLEYEVSALASITSQQVGKFDINVQQKAKLRITLINYVRPLINISSIF